MWEYMRKIPVKFWDKIYILVQMSSEIMGEVLIETSDKTIPG